MCVTRTCGRRRCSRHARLDSPATGAAGFVRARRIDAHVPVCVDPARKLRSDGREARSACSPNHSCSRAHADRRYRASPTAAEAALASPGPPVGSIERLRALSCGLGRQDELRWPSTMPGCPARRLRRLGECGRVTNQLSEATRASNSPCLSRLPTVPSSPLADDQPAKGAQPTRATDGVRGRTKA